MLFYNYDRNGGERVSDFRDLLYGQSAFLVGGAPSLKEQNYALFQDRCITTFALNNIGTLFQPDFIVACDEPVCFDPLLLMDPKPIKFFSRLYKDKKVEFAGKTLKEMPNSHFFSQEHRTDDSELFAEKHDLFWKRSSLFSAIAIMGHLGIRKIYLAGSDFGPNEYGEDYSSGSKLTNPEKKWNEILYKSQIQDLLKLKPVFDGEGIELIDTSKNTKLSSVYRTTTIDDAVREIKASFPSSFVDPKTLPHVSRLTTQSDIENVLSTETIDIQEPTDLPKGSEEGIFL